MPNKKIHLLAQFLSGTLLVTAFAPVHWHYLAPAIFAFLYCQWQEQTPKQAWLTGYAFGLGLFSTGTWWVYIAVNNPTYGIHNALVAALITIALIAWLACFPALTGWCMQQLQPKHSLFKSLLLFPTIWTLGEWLREHTFTGFPWMSLGYSQLSTPLQGFAPIFGVYGVSFFMLMVAGLISYGYLSQAKNKVFATTCLLSIFALGWGLDKIQWTSPVQAPPVKASLLQMNIPIEYKWHLENQMTIYQAYDNTTRKLIELHRDIIVWPEGAVPAYLHHFESPLTKLSDLALKNHAVILAGIPILQNNHSYNSIIALGHGEGIYHKHHLVPFGEYLPFATWFASTAERLNIAVSMYSPGPENQAPLKFGNIPLSPFICYEITYPNLVRLAVKESELLITVTDDAWFGHSIAADLHLEIAQMRSLENGREQLFNANTGITAAINIHGNIIKQLPQHTRGVLDVTVQRWHNHTPWHTLGNWPLWLISLIVLGISWRKHQQPEDVTTITYHADS